MPETAWKPTDSASADPFGGALHALRFCDALCCRSLMTAPWGVSIPAPEATLTFTTVLQGECLLRVPGETERSLRTGQFTLIGPCGRYEMRSGRAVKRYADLEDMESRSLGLRYESMEYGGGGEACVMFCGIVRPDHPLTTRIIEAMPSVVHVDGWESPHSELLRSVMGMMVHEAARNEPGGAASITRLADLLVLQGIRSWLRSSESFDADWLNALRDPHIGRAVAAIHRDPGRGWTLNELSSESGLSRSAFAASFAKQLGETPMQYVTEWRVEVASSMIRLTATPIVQIAEQLGYSSETAFARAFKRTTGRTPGSLRRVE